MRDVREIFINTQSVQVTKQTGQKVSVCERCGRKENGAEETILWGLRAWEYVTFFGKDAVKYLGPGEGKLSKIVQIISFKTQEFLKSGKGSQKCETEIFRYWAWWFTLAIQALQRLQQGDCCEPPDTLDHIVCSRLAWTLEFDPVTSKQANKFHLQLLHLLLKMRKQQRPIAKINK